MRLRKTILIGFAIGLVVIQFFQPAKNKSDKTLAVDFTSIYIVPDSVQSILQAACYDCHSNNTSYPWYVNIQPMGWLMAKHIRNGKAKLNFSEFGNYSARRQISKLKGIASQIKDGDMPLSSYKMMHKAARLSMRQQQLMINWFITKADSISFHNQ